jgi:two-component system, NtrC family, response regulator AtoC
MTLAFRVTPPASAVVHQLSPAMALVMSEAERVARGNISVLIVGETGVGKDVLAQQMHLLSPRASHPFMRLNCAALTESLVESELFGHEKGAFSGAMSTKCGLIEAADPGTVFLDEVAELPLTTQAKLLRVIEQKEFFRVGGVNARQVEVRFLAATNRNLELEVLRGRFRQDLLFRLKGALLRVPPLRERREEILPLARRFIEEAAGTMAIPAPALAEEARSFLWSYAWPGNVRELKNAIDRAVLLRENGAIRAEHVKPPTHVALALPERERIVQALAEFGGNQTRAARCLGMSRNTLLGRIERYGLARPRQPC